MNITKKKIIIICSAVLLVVGALSVFSYIRQQKELTRFKWIEMLCMEENIDGGSESDPYYLDVRRGNKYYDSVQSAAEHDIIPLTKRFKGKKKATGEFVAITAIRSVGENRLKLALDIEDGLDDSNYIDIALKYDLISEEKLDSAMTEDDCRDILDRLNSLYFSAFWKDDYEEVTYKDGVLEIPDKMVEFIGRENGEYTSIDCYDNVEISDGTVVVFTDERTGIKVAKKVLRADGYGLYELTDATLEETVSKLRVSDITEITAQDIINYYGLESASGSTETKTFPFNSESQGFTVKFESGDDDGSNWLKVSIVDNATGLKTELPAETLPALEEELSGEINISRIAVAGTVDYDVLEGFKCADVAVDADISAKAGLKVSSEKRIPLFKVTVPLAYGAAAINARINLVINTEGTVTLSADIPVMYNLGYDSKTGKLRNHNDISVENGSFTIDCKGSLDGELQSILSVLQICNIVDAEASVGANAEAKTENRKTGMVCTDVSIKAPVAKLSIFGDDEAESILNDVIGKVYDTDRLNWTFDSIAKEYSLHHEIGTDGTRRFVDQCTYDGKAAKATGEIEKPEEEEEILLDKTYAIQFDLGGGNTSPAFEFDYSGNWDLYDTGMSVDHSSQGIYLTNDRGGEIRLMHLSNIVDQGGGYGMRFDNAWTQKVADSSFRYGSFGDFAVAQMFLENGYSYYGGETEDWQEIWITQEDDNYRYSGKDRLHSMYGVLPESSLGTWDSLNPPRFTTVGGEKKVLMFEYTQGYDLGMIAYPPEDGWTEDELEEVLAILASFRIKKTTEFSSSSEEHDCDYGKVISTTASIACKDCGKTLLDYRFDRFELNGQYSQNAQKINEYLKEELEENYGQYLDEKNVNIEDKGISSICTEHEYQSEAICSSVMEVTLVGKKHLSVYMCENIEIPSAMRGGYVSYHSYLFNLDTGEQEGIAGLFSGSREEFKTLVAEKTVDHYLNATGYERSTLDYCFKNKEEVYDAAYKTVDIEDRPIKYTEDGIYYVFETGTLTGFTIDYVGEIFIPYSELTGGNTDF